MNLKRKDMPLTDTRRILLRRQQGKLKKLMTFAYGIRDVLTSHRVEIGQTVKGMYYKGYIQKVLQPAILYEASRILAAGPIILYNNTAPHLSKGVTSLLARYKWDTLSHPPSSPDLSLCGFFFPSLKENMRGVTGLR